jgi:probable rRNA maturation factor
MGTVADRSSRLYLPPLRIDVTVRTGVRRLGPLTRLGRAIRAAAWASGAPTPASVGLVLTDDTELAGLNREHMGKRGATDVLSFPLLPPEGFAREGRRGREGSRRRDHRQSIASMTSMSCTGSPEAFVLPPGVRTALGDIAVSVERAITQAREGRGGQDTHTPWDAQDELLLLVIHGTLHLCGWDHAKPEEDRAMRALGRELMESSTDP